MNLSEGVGGQGLSNESQANEDNSPAAVELLRARIVILLGVGE